MNIDEMPVGQHTAMEIPEYITEEKPIETSNLPLIDRLTSKITKLRLEAFNELYKLFTEASHSDPIFGLYSSSFSKYLSDSHPSAQERAMDCLLLLVTKSRETLPDVQSLVTVLIEKGFTSTKNGVRNKASSCLSNIGQLENTAGVIYESIIELVKSKNFKVSIAGIRALTELLANFGSLIYPIQPTLKIIVPLGSSTNTGIRSESMNYLKEAYRWIKEGLFPALSGLKESQQEELKTYCATLSNTIAEPKLAISGTLEKKVENPVKIKARKRDTGMDLGKFDEDWCENLLQTKKWSEKRDMLEEVMKVLQDESAKLENYSSITQCLKKLLDNSNIVVVNSALKCLGLLASALKGTFGSSAKNILNSVVQKCKDKKTLTEAQKCMELFIDSFNITEILDDIKDMLGDKSPLMKVHICNWLEKSVIKRMSMEDIVFLTPILGKLTDDASCEVRDAALSCIGTMKATKDCAVLNKMVKEMIPQKQEKIEQMLKSTGEAMDIEVPEEKIRVESVKVKKVQQVKAVNKEEENLEEVIQVLAEKFPSEILEGLSKANWKEKQKSLQTIGQLIEAKTDLEPQHINGLGSLLTARLKSYRESNLVVLKEGIHILTIISSNYSLNAKFLNTVVTPGLIEKLGDVKIAEHTNELLFLIADSVTPKQVTTLIMKRVGTTKNPNTIKGSLTVLDKFIKTYTSTMVPIKAMIEFAKQYMGHTNPQIRNSAIGVLCRMYAEIGEPIKPLLTSELKDSTIKALELELSKTPMEKSTEITRNIKGETEKEWLLKKASKASIMDTLLPRTNIAPMMTSKILSGLTNSGMKQRQEAKDALEKILFVANFKIQATGLSPLFNALKTRMNEPCKNLAKGFISLVGALASSMGSGVRQYAKIILQPLLYNLADKQNAIRVETLQTLDKFAEAAGADCIINAASILLEKDNPELRSGILRWILNHKQELEKADMSPLIRGLVSCMQDRSKDIRTMAEEIIGETVPLVGHEAFMEGIKDLKPTVRETLKVILNKYRVMVPCYNQTKVEAMEDIPINEIACNKEEQKITQPTFHQPVMDFKDTELVLADKVEMKECREEVKQSETIASLLVSALSSFEILKVLNDRIKSDPNSLLSETTQILRWISLKISINILNKPASDFLYSFFSLFISNHITLSDSDASIILPIICDKFSGCNELFSLLCSGVYSPSKVLYFLSEPLEYAPPSVKLECLTNIKHVLISQGRVALEHTDVKVFVRLLSTSEENVRNEAMKLIGEVYKILGEAIWSQLIDVTESQRVQLKLIFNNIGSENNIIKSLKKCSIGEKSGSTTRKSSTLKRSTSRIMKIESLDECLEQLKYGEISNKIDALIYIGEKATFAMDGVSDLIPTHCNEIVAAFTEVMKELFDMGFNEVHLRFIKYFMNVINKICSSKVIVDKLNETELYNIIEQLLVKLLFDGLESLGPNNEGEALMKCINSTILRLLENCQSTRVYCVLIALLRVYTFNTSPNPLLTPSMSSKFPGLIVKCLLKLTKVIEQLIPNMDLARLLLAIHEFLISIPPQPHSMSSNEEIASRIIKTIINEVVKVKREQIWEAYKEVQKHKVPDTHIERWIKVILKSLQVPVTSGQKTNEQVNKRLLSEGSEVLVECKNRLAGLQSSGDIYERINQFKMRMMQKKPN